MQKDAKDAKKMQKAHPDAPLRDAADAFFVNVSTISRFVQDMRREGKL